MMKNMCPGCMKHCYLDEAHCERGVVYAETGSLPPRRPRLEGQRAERKMPEGKMKYFAMSSDEKICHSLVELSREISEGLPPEDLLSCLRDTDRESLLMLLEKMRHVRIHAHKL